MVNVTVSGITEKVTTPSSGNVGAAYSYSLPPPELYYYHVAYLSLAIAVGVPGNTLVLAAYAAVKTKTSCDWYILHIAVLDLIICLFRVPTHLAMETGHWQNNGTSGLCKFVYWLSQAVITASVILFGFIAIDRYIKVCKPSVRISARFSRNCVLVISGLSLLSAIPTFWMYANNARGKCAVASQELGPNFLKDYYTVLFAAYLLMLAVVIVCYSFIISKVRKSQLIMKAHQAQESMGSKPKGSKKNAPRGHQLGVVTVDHNPSLDEGCPTTAIPKLSDHRDATTGAGGVGASSSLSVDMARRLRQPKKAWMEIDHDVHEKSQGAKLVSFSTHQPSEIAAPPERSLENDEASCDPNMDSTPDLSPSVPDASEGGEKNGQSSSRPGNGDQVHHAHEGQSEADRGKSADASKRKVSNSPPAVMESLENEGFESFTIRDATRDRSADNTTAPSQTNPTEDCHLHMGQDVNVPENPQAFPRNLTESTDRNHSHLSNGTGNNAVENRNHTSATSTEARKETPEKSDQPKEQRNKGSRRLFRFKRSSQVQPLPTIPSVSQYVSSQHGTSGAPSDDGQTNFSPELSKTTAGGTVTGTVKMSRASMQRTSRSFRLTLLLLLVTVVFVVSWIPPYVAMVWYFYVGYVPPLSSSDLALQMYAPTGYVLNHFANPILYLGLSSSFRENVAALWKKITSKLRFA